MRGAWHSVRGVWQPVRPAAAPRRNGTSPEMRRVQGAEAVGGRGQGRGQRWDQCKDWNQWDQECGQWQRHVTCHVTGHVRIPLAQTRIVVEESWGLVGGEELREEEEMEEESILEGTEEEVCEREKEVRRWCVWSSSPPQ